MEKSKSIYDFSKPSNAPRKEKLLSQKQLLDYWNEKFNEMIHLMKLEIMEVIDE